MEPSGTSGRHYSKDMMSRTLLKRPHSLVVLAMLDEDYLMNLPKLSNNHSEEFHFDRSPQNLRTLWYSYGLAVLRWAKIRPEGHEQGFSEEVHRDLRETIFPFPKVEHVVLIGYESESSVQGPPQQYTYHPGRTVAGEFVLVTTMTDNHYKKTGGFVTSQSREIEVAVTNANAFRNIPPCSRGIVTLGVNSRRSRGAVTRESRP